MHNDIELAWAAGFFEGDGCININCYPRKNRTGQCGLRLIIEQAEDGKLSLFRFHTAIGEQYGTLTYSEYDKSKRKNQPVWRVSINAYPEVMAVINSLYPYLTSGGDKMLDIDKALEHYEYCKRTIRRPNGLSSSDVIL